MYEACGICYRNVQCEASANLIGTFGLKIVKSSSYL